MRGLMQETPLVLNDILDYAARFHGDQEVVSRNVEGETVVRTYAEVHVRAQQVALALKSLGVRAGDRVATLAWNTARHFELWYGIMGLGAIVHTVNPRLFVKDLEYIINHAEDSVLLFDISFVKLVSELRPLIPTVKMFVVMTDRRHMPAPNAAEPLLCYEDWIAPHASSLPFKWEVTDENMACGLCYTSGTTGRPKGVLYSHRANYLHSLGFLLPDCADVSSRDSLLMVVPMFHANAWGIVFAAPLAGARLVLPGPFLDGPNLFRCIEDFEVTSSAAVPTIWLGLLQYMRDNQLRPSTLKRTIVGGAAAPFSMIKEYQETYGVEVRHIWGMTELTPIGTVAGLKGTLRHISPEEQLNLQAKQGRGHPLVGMRIVGDDGKEKPWDGKSFGNLQVRGPHVVRAYFKLNDAAVDEDGWFETGDVATIDANGYMQITDRSKDVIKSGGEWISSIEIECAAQAHPKVIEAAVIGIPDPKWSERPLLVVVASPKDPPSRDELLDFLKDKVARWWIPDDVVFVDEIPHTATGKIHKLVLRHQLKDYQPRQSKL